MISDEIKTKKIQEFFEKFNDPVILNPESENKNVSNCVLAATANYHLHISEIQMD